jgi:transcriptional regulator with XRE-family HTH domain
MYLFGTGAPMTLKEWRESEGLTQAALASELGIHTQYLSDIERGVRTPGGGLANRIRRRSQDVVTLDDLLRDDAQEAA